MDNAGDPEEIASNLYSVVQCVSSEHTGPLQAKVNVWRPHVNAALSYDLGFGTIVIVPRDET